VLFAPGAFITTMPRALAAPTSTLSHAGSRTGNHRNRDAAEISGDVTFVALRTTSASGVGEIVFELIEGPARDGVDRPAFGGQQVDGGCREIVCDNDFQWRLGG